MKNLLLSIFLLFALTSCIEESKKTNTAEAKDPISDPNIFIGEHKAKAMVLGVFHFSNPGLDSYKPKFPFNILEEKRQKELNELLERIAIYKPTKILLEWSRIKSDSAANSRYQAYLSDNFDLSDKTNEVYQIGFKLAKKLNHERIFCSDANAEWFGVDLDWDNYDDVAYLKSRGQLKKSIRYDFNSFYELSDSLKTIQTLSEHLNMINGTENRLKDHQAYLTGIIEGAGDNYLGADAVANWYRRNLRIFANAYDLTNFDQEERLLLIYGSGHVWQLRQLFTDSPDFDYIEVNEFLDQ